MAARCRGGGFCLRSLMLKDQGLTTSFRAPTSRLCSHTHDIEKLPDSLAAVTEADFSAICQGDAGNVCHPSLREECRMRQVKEALQAASRHEVSQEGLQDLLPPAIHLVVQCNYTEKVCEAHPSLLSVCRHPQRLPLPTATPSTLRHPSTKSPSNYACSWLL